LGFLVDNSKGLVASLTDKDNFEDSDGGIWLRERYAELVPIILVDVVTCVETQRGLSASTFVALRASARSVVAMNAPLPTVLSGGVPALHVFGAFLEANSEEINSLDRSAWLSRGSILALKIGAYWAEEWAHAQRTPAEERAGKSLDPAPGGTSHIDLVAVPGHLAQPALDMVLLAAQGQSNDQIARSTDYSPQAVKWHLGRAMRTWNVCNRASLIASALLRGAIRSPNDLAASDWRERRRKSRHETVTNERGVEGQG
jgi:DNA-binding CsgD family transcriptional regulator